MNKLEIIDAIERANEVAPNESLKALALELSNQEPIMTTGDVVSIILLGCGAIALVAMYLNDKVSSIRYNKQRELLLEREEQIQLSRKPLNW